MLADEMVNRHKFVSAVTESELPISQICDLFSSLCNSGWVRLMRLCWCYEVAAEFVLLTSDIRTSLFGGQLFRLALLCLIT